MLLIWLTVWFVFKSLEIVYSKESMDQMSK